MSANYIPPMTTYSQPHQYINIADNAATSLYSQYLQTQHDFVSSILSTATSSLETNIMANILQTLEQDKTKTQNIMMVTLCQLAQRIHCNGALLENILSQNDDEKSQQNLHYTLTSLSKHQHTKLQTIENELIIMKKHLKSNESILKQVSNQLNTFIKQTNASKTTDSYPKDTEKLMNKINKMDKKINMIQNKQLKSIKNNDENMKITKQMSIDNHKTQEIVLSQSIKIKSIQNKMETLTTSREMSSLFKQISAMKKQISKSNAPHKQISSLTAKISSLSAKISSIQTHKSIQTHTSQNLSKNKYYSSPKTAPINDKQIPNPSSQNIDPSTIKSEQKHHVSISPTTSIKTKQTEMTKPSLSTDRIDDTLLPIEPGIPTNSISVSAKIYPTIPTPKTDVHNSNDEIESASIVSENSSATSATLSPTNDITIIDKYFPNYNPKIPINLIKSTPATTTAILKSTPTTTTNPKPTPATTTTNPKPTPATNSNTTPTKISTISQHPKPNHNTTTILQESNTIQSNDTTPQSTSEHGSICPPIAELKKQLHTYLKSSQKPTLHRLNAQTTAKKLPLQWYYEDKDTPLGENQIIRNHFNGYKIDINIKTLAMNPFSNANIIPPKNAIEKAANHKRSGNELWQEQEYCYAYDDYITAIQLDPTNVTYKLNAAAAALKLDGYKQALYWCKDALLYSQDAQSKCKAYRRMGIAEEKNGNITKCIEYYRKAQDEIFDSKIEKQIKLIDHKYHN